MSQYASGNPARMGRRVWARVIDSTLAVVLAVGVQAAAIAAVRGLAAPALVALVLVVLVAWTGFGLWTLLARAALPGQWLLGLHHVDASGERAGAKTLMKYLVQGCTCGLAVVITPLTIEAPNRSWFDRICGVTLVDAKEPGAVTPVPSRLTAPPPGGHSDPAQLTRTGHVTRAPVALPPARIAATVTVDNGEMQTLVGTTIVGRAPRQSRDLGHAMLLAVADQSVSANHVALGLGPTGPWVMDLRSTNGSSVQQDGRAPVRLEPMTKVGLAPGAVVKIGQRTLTVRPG